MAAPLPSLGPRNSFRPSHLRATLLVVGGGATMQSWCRRWSHGLIPFLVVAFFSTTLSRGTTGTRRFKDRKQLSYQTALALVFVGMRLW